MKLRKFKPEDIDQVTNLFYDTVHSVNAADYDETQRQGVAALICIQLKQDARALGFKEITSEVSITAKPVAEQGGFIVVKAQDKEHNGVILRNYVMKKEL